MQEKGHHLCQFLLPHYSAQLGVRMIPRNSAQSGTQNKPAGLTSSSCQNYFDRHIYRGIPRLFTFMALRGDSAEFHEIIRQFILLTSLTCQRRCKLYTVHVVAPKDIPNTP